MTTKTRVEATITQSNRIVIGVSLAIAMLVCVTAIALWTLRSYRRADQERGQSYQILDALCKLVQIDADAQTIYRTYAATADRSFTNLIRAASGSFHSTTSQLASLIKGNAEEERALRDLEQLADKEFALLQESLDIHPNNPANTNRVASSNRERWQIMGKIRGLCEKIRNKELGLSQARDSIVEIRGNTAWVVISAGFLLAVLSVSLTGWFARQEAGRRRSAEETREQMQRALWKSNAELEQHVHERTEQLAVTNAKLRTEIEERKRVAEQLLEQAMLLDQAPDAFLVQDLQDRIVYWNEGAQRIYGWNRDEAVGQFAAALLRPADAVQWQKANQEILDKGEWTGELRQTSKDGKNLIIESRCLLLRDSKGQAKSKLVINTNATEKKALEAQFLRAQRLESIGTLAGGVAHDLNNVLAPILMGLELLREKLSDAESLAIIESSEKSAQRGSDIIKQILSFARGVTGERALCTLKHLLKEQEKFCKETFPPSIQVRTNAVQDLWPVLGNLTQLHQVLMNLSINARDAMPTGGTLMIEAENTVLDELYAKMHPDVKPGAYVMIRVRDTGTGIVSQHLEKIFDPFFTTKEPGKGTGLGLSTALGIVKSHGGFINVYSEAGCGTEFKVYLPATLEADHKPAANSRPVLTKGNRETILVVDDEQTVREMTKSALESHGYQVLTANDGSEAISVYSEFRRSIPLVLTDMSMPVLDGTKTIRALHAINPDLKIIAVSGMLDQAKTTEVSRKTNVVLLQKPFSIQTLLSHIAQALDGRVIQPEGQFR